MTTLIQPEDASAEMPSSELFADDWIEESESAEFDRAELPVGANDQPMASLRADSEIAAEIRGYLRRGLQVEDTAICIQVSHGEVLLTGELARQMHVHRLLERVNGIRGVVSVTNRVTARYNDAVVPFAWGFTV